MVAHGRGRRRAPGRADRDVRDRLLDGHRPHRRAARRPEHRVPRRAGRASTASGCAASVPPRASRAARGPPTRWCSPRPTARCTATQDPPVLATPASTSTTPRATEHVTVDVEGVRAQPVRLLRPALRRRVLGPRRRTPTATSCPANWPAPRREHWRTLLRARAIENQAYVVGVNRVGDGRRPRLRRRQQRSSGRSARCSPTAPTRGGEPCCSPTSTRRTSPRSARSSPSSPTARAQRVGRLRGRHAAGRRSGPSVAGSPAGRRRAPVTRWITRGSS